MDPILVLLSAGGGRTQAIGILTGAALFSALGCARPALKATACITVDFPDPQKDLTSRSHGTMGKLYKGYIGVIMGLYRGSNF